MEKKGELFSMTKWNCPKCNELINSWDLFCRRCGKKFHKTLNDDKLKFNELYQVRRI